MKFKEYTEKVKKTEMKDYSKVKVNPRLLHAVMGMGDEMGEIHSQFKKHWLYGKNLDVVNIIEELGDFLWFSALMMDELGIDFEKVLSTNIEKLKKRYQDEFTVEKFTNRNTDAERKVLEECNKGNEKEKGKKSKKG